MDEVSSADATRQLEQQRDDVRAAAQELLAGAERVLPGRTTQEVGRWDGCESVFPEGFGNFQYVGQARVDVAPVSTVAAPYLAPLQPVLEQAGFEVEGPTERDNGWTTLTGTKDDLTAVFKHTGAGAFVGLAVYGECVDVPKDDRDAWLLRDDPTPLR